MATTTEDFVKPIPEFTFTKGDYTGMIKDACGVPAGSDMNAIYLGLQTNPFQQSAVRPTSLTGSEKMTFYDPGCAIRLNGGSMFARTVGPEISQQILDMKVGDAMPLVPRPTRGGGWQYRTKQWDEYGIETDIQCWRYTLSVGRDQRGKYLSFFDIWDFAPGKGGSYDKPDDITTKLASTMLPYVGTPIPLYKRFYFDQYGITEDSLRSSAATREAGR
jgi:hypothetical protein